MIAKYKEQYFNISLIKKPIKIWRYDYVEGFHSSLHEDGFMVYKKFVELSEIDEIFDAAFTAKWNGIYFGAYPVHNNSICLKIEKADVAEKFEFLEDIKDRGETILWYKVVDIDSCEEFEIFYTDYYSKKEIEKIVSKAEWIKLYKKLRTELRPPR